MGLHSKSRDTDSLLFLQLLRPAFWQSCSQTSTQLVPVQVRQIFIYYLVLEHIPKLKLLQNLQAGFNIYFVKNIARFIGWQKIFVTDC